MAEDDDSARGAETAPDAAVRVELGIEIIDGPDRHVRYDAAGPEMTIGTSPENDLVLTDSTVSAHHIWLRARDGVLVRDLGSCSGTFLGGVRIREAIVPVGTRLRIGQTVLKVVDATVRDARAVETAAGVPGLVGFGPAMRGVIRAVERLSQSDV